MKVLVTGGCGFLGSYVVDRLVEEGHLVIVKDDLSTAELEDDGRTPRYLNQRAFYYLEDSAPPLTEGIEGFVHLALRHPLERERALYQAAWHGYVRQGVETVFGLLNLRAPLSRVVIGGFDEEIRKRRELPEQHLQYALGSALEYWHRPGSLSIHLLALPELYGERRATAYAEGATNFAPVGAAVDAVSRILTGKPRREFLQRLPAEVVRKEPPV